MNKLPHAVVALAIAGLVAASPARADERLTVVSWGGSYGRSQTKAFIEPFRKAGFDVTMEEFGKGLDDLGVDLKARRANWDVIDIDSLTAFVGCQEGVLEKIDWKKLGLDRRKFVGAGEQNCAVPSVVYATVVVYDSTVLKSGPQKITDLFDLKSFPGKRALRKSPVVNLEWALIADGVAQNNVYKVLRTKAGIDRAFKKLDTIKDQIVWWQQGDEPLQLLSRGSVAMASAWNGRVTEAVRDAGRSYAIVWNNAGLDWVWWGIVKSSPRKELGYKFVAFASDADRMAEQAGYMAYGPANTDALAKVNASILPNLPTAPTNMSTALLVDTKFWVANGDDLRSRFKAWTEK